MEALVRDRIVGWVDDAASNDPMAVLDSADRLIAWAEAQRTRAIDLLRADGRSASARRSG